VKEKFSPWKKSFKRLEDEVSVYNTPKAHIIRISPRFKDYFSNVKYVKLFIDRSKKRFAIKPLQEFEKDSYKVSKTKSSQAFDIYPYSFLKRLKIPHGRYKALWDEDKKMLIVNLKEGP